MPTKPNILIVDDDPIVLALATDTLAPHFHVFCAQNVDQALKLAQQHTIDLALLDIIMPKVNGFELADKLHAHHPQPPLPVIFLTADHSEATIEKAFQAGGLDYILKPFKERELLVRINNHLRMASLHAELGSALNAKQQLLEVFNDFVLYLKIDASGTINEMSTAFEDALQCSHNQWKGEKFSAFLDYYTSEMAYKLIWQALQKNQTFSGEIQAKNADGGMNWYKVTFKPEYQGSKRIGFIGFYINIDDKKLYQQHSITDHLTGISNRAGFEKQLDDEIERAQRYNQHFSIIMIDIDHFKLVNDTHGHVIGDVFLKELADLIRNSCRHADFPARWGGEEFVILCPHTELAGALKSAEELRKKIEKQPFSTIGHKTASFGVAQYQANDTSQSLFSKVDKALYISKNTGRNKVSSQ